jgi:hypothetical protein
MSEDRAASRRAVLAAGAAGAAALVAGAVGTDQAEAAGTPLNLNSVSNTASSPTGLEVTGSNVAYGIGVTDNGLGTAPAGDPAILGHAGETAFHTGVMGYAPNGGTAVLGSAANNGIGVWGTTDGSVGVLGEAQAGGLGVSAAANLPGIALKVTGVAQFSTGGQAFVTGTTATPKSSVVVRTNVLLTPNSVVLATVQQTAGGAMVKAAVPNVPKGTITIYLNKAVTTTVTVGWFILN